MRSSVLTPEFCGYLHLRFIRHLHGFGRYNLGDQRRDYEDGNEKEKLKRAGLVKNSEGYVLDRLNIALGLFSPEQLLKKRGPSD